jgi:TonB family protein
MVSPVILETKSVMRLLPFVQNTTLCLFFTLYAWVSGVVFTQAPSLPDNGNQTHPSASIGFSSEPRLLSGGKVEFPAELVKQGVEGAVEVRVNIDTSGRVEACDIATAFHPLLDSLVVSAMRTARFSPAYESGKAVPATISMQLAFDLKTICATSADAPSELCGVVIDRSTGKPVGGATITIECLDSLADPDIGIGMGRYLALIGNVPGQSSYLSTLSTTADSLGSFSLRLLPSGPLRMAVAAYGYEAGHFRQQVVTGIQQSAVYYLYPLSAPVSDSIVVYGYLKHESEMNVEQQQNTSGLTTCLSDMLKSQTAITGVPEAASVMTARGGSPFDNRYLINGVPFLAPFHFGGHPYADIDGMMISSLKNVKVTVNRIAGVFPEASGILLEADPGIYRSNNWKLVRRPEFAIDYGFINKDFLLSIPVSKNRNDFIQIGYTRSDDSILKGLQNPGDYFGESVIGPGRPTSMGNLTLNGSNTWNGVLFDGYAWFAWDTYTPWVFDTANVEPPFSYPWGMGSISIHPPGRETPTVRYGGSHQYFMDGKRVGDNAFLKTVFLSNGSVSVLYDSMTTQYFNAQLDCRVDYENWHGSVAQRDTFGLDTGIRAKGRDIAGTMNGSVERQFGVFEVGSDVLGSVLFDNQGALPDLVLDAGLSLQWKSDRFLAELHGGRVTSRPDVRGMPDSLFRREHLHAWLLSMPLLYNGGRVPVRFSVQPYVRYQDRAPCMNPLLYVWDEELTTPMFGQGVDISGEIEPREWFSLNGAFNLNRARRFVADTVMSFEWNTPWTFRCCAHFNYRKKFHAYINSTTSSGFPYYDFDTRKYVPLPFYRRIDINLQYREVRLKHRFLTRYDGYFNIKNILNVNNIRDYYWNAAMVKQEVQMSTLIMDLGVRFGFRL